MRWISLVALSFLVAAPAFADDASRLKTARDIIETTHASDHIRTLMPTLMKQMRPLLLQQGGDEKSIDAFSQTFLHHVDQDVDRFTDLAAHIYAREFSEQDLDDLLAFYTSRAGQDLVGKQVELTQAMMQAGQEWGQLTAAQVLNEFRQQKTAASPKL